MKTLATLLVRLLVFVAAVIVIALSVRFFSGAEDVWICENGQWVAHGSPAQPMPEEPCLNPDATENQSEQLSENSNDAIFNKDGYIVLNSDNSWGLVYTEKETPSYELGSTVLQLEPTSICFIPGSDIGQPCARTSWQAGAQAALIGEILKPGLTKVLQLRIFSAKTQ